MTHGLDSSFLVAVEVVEHPHHSTARQTLEQIVGGGEQVAIAPQVLAEFMHVVTDHRRFVQPLAMKDARALAGRWWAAREVDHVFPTDAAAQLFVTWIEQFKLGRKRLLDTLLAATYHAAGVKTVLTLNPSDFTVFGVFDFVGIRDG